MNRASVLALGLALGAVFALGGCGLQPVYSGGSHGVAATTLTQIAVAPIPDRAGYLVVAALHDRLGATIDAPKFRLEVELDDQIVGFGVRGDNSIARERRTLRARYRLVDIATGGLILDATATSDAGIDRVSSDYAVVAAETTALERLATNLAAQISVRLARFAQTGGMVGAQ
jgi:LPS-assembly lipoprotein